MPQKMIYGGGLLVYLAATSMTIAAVALPNWLVFDSPDRPHSPSDPPSNPVRVTYGLHQRCSSLAGTCTAFPTELDCHAEDRYFCSIWRSLGFLMNIAVVFELACFVGFMVVLFSGRTTREGGWKMVTGLLATVSICQCASMAIVAFLHDHDSRFSLGWSLGKSTVLCTVSWALLVLDAVGIVSAAYLQPEDDYEPLLAE